MKNTGKALVAGIVIGAAIATTAIGHSIYKILQGATVHLFDLSNQEGKEDLIDSLIPNNVPEEETVAPAEPADADTIHAKSEGE